MASAPVPLFQHASFGPFFDAVPAMLLVLDFDARIHAMNAAASEGLGLELEEVHHHKTGDVLHCLHAAYAQEGCGRSDFCRSCVIRNAVVQAMAGARTSRTGVRMVLQADGQTRDIHVLVSASPVTWQGHAYAILMLENVSDLFQLRHLLPIDPGAGRQGVPHREGGGGLGQAGDEGVGDALGDDEPGRGRAAVPGAEEGPVQGAVHRVGEVGVVQHHQGVLAPHLALDPLAADRSRKLQAEYARYGKSNKAECRIEEVHKKPALQPRSVR